MKPNESHFLLGKRTHPFPFSVAACVEYFRGVKGSSSTGVTPQKCYCMGGVAGSPCSVFVLYCSS